MSLSIMELMKASGTEGKSVNWFLKIDIIALILEDPIVYHRRETNIQQNLEPSTQKC